MLITAGNNNKFNTMTASWGTLGIMWGKMLPFLSLDLKDILKNL